MVDCTHLVTEGTLKKLTGLCISSYYGADLIMETNWGVNTCPYLILSPGVPV